MAGDLTRSSDHSQELTVAGQRRIRTGFAAFWSLFDCGGIVCLAIRNVKLTGIVMEDQQEY